MSVNIKDSDVKDNGKNSSCPSNDEDLEDWPELADWLNKTIKSIN